ncbi:MAG: flagellar hook-associated protein FlgL [Bdellovibrionota bacterium]
MASTRISENYRFDTTIDRIGNARTDADGVGETASSGRKIKKISDDPTSTVKVLRNRAALTNIDQFKKTIEFGKEFLTRTEDTLSSIYDSLTRAKELAIQQGSTTYDQPDRSAVAAEIKQIMLHVTRLGNARYGDKYIFGGFQTSNPPLSPDGNYLGDDGQIFIQMDEDSFRPININGRTVFDVPPEEENTRPPLIAVLQNLHDSLDNYDKDKLYKAMDDLDKGMNTVLKARTSLGARRNAIDDVSERLEKSEVQLTVDNNNLESADMVKTALDLKRAESALQFTLQASSKMITPSLLDFLK